MTAPVLATDVEGAVRQWARTHPGLTPLVGTRTFFSFPDRYSLATQGPAITVMLVSDVADDHTPTGQSLIQFDAYAATKADAGQVRAALVNALWTLNHYNDHPGAVLVNATGITARYGPDVGVDPDIPRYIVDAVLFTGPSEALGS